VSSDPVGLAVGADDHRHCVPADDALNPPFDLQIARVARLRGERNRIDVRRVRSKRHADASQVRTLLQSHQEFPQLVGAVAMQHIVERLAPLIQFARMNARVRLTSRFINHVIDLPITIE
jgi:hypothetical protein